MRLDFVPFSPFIATDISERNLPHWNQTNRAYFVTFRLADSIPVSKLKQYQTELDSWIRLNPEPLTDKQVSEYAELFPNRFHKWMDEGIGECILRQQLFSQIVGSALKYFDGQRYSLDEFVVMPNHVHVLVSPINAHQLSAILHSWKSFTAHEINRKLARNGKLWQQESYDHIVRSVEQLQFYRSYIKENPVKANLKSGEFLLGEGTGINA